MKLTDIELKERYEEFREAELENEILEKAVKKIKIELLRNNIKEAISIQSRLKSLNSIFEKVELGKVKIKRLEDVQDILGIRIILLFDKDIQRVVEILEKQFKIKRKRDTSERLRENEFGYKSLHLIAEIDKEEYEGYDFKKITCEIQIRTLAQHLWAEMSHFLQYKEEENIPENIKRAVFRMSAILELTDIELQRILDEKERYIASLSPIEKSEPINSINMEEIFKKMLPKENDISRYKHYENLIEELESEGIKETNELIGLIKSKLEVVLKYDKKMANEYAKRYEHVPTQREYEKLTNARKGIFFSYVGLIRNMIKK